MEFPASGKTVGDFTIELHDGDRSSCAWYGLIYLHGHKLDQFFSGDDWRVVLATAEEWCKKQNVKGHK